jgi:hypothetical protein
MRLVPESTSLCNLLISRLHHTARISPREEVTCNRDSALFKRFCLFLRHSAVKITTILKQLDSSTQTHLVSNHQHLFLISSFWVHVWYVTRFSHEYFRAVLPQQRHCFPKPDNEDCIYIWLPHGMAKIHKHQHISLQPSLENHKHSSAPYQQNPLLTAFIIMSWIKVGKSSMGKPCIIKHQGSKPAKTDKPTQPTKLANITTFDHGQLASDPAKKPAKIIYGSWLRNV